MTLNILGCPKCDGRPPLLEGEGKAVLTCSSCGTKFKSGRIFEFAKKGDADLGFDHRWRVHPRPQPTTPEQLLQKTGWEPTAFAEKTVLDGGCGVGRYCAMIAANGGSAVGVDVSSHALKAASENAEASTLILADLLHLPIQNESVDMALSIGVLHHLSDPRAGFAEIARTVKKGGQMAVWVYTDHAGGDATTRLAIEFLHEITRACPPKALYNAIEKYAVPLRNAFYPGWEALHKVLRVSYNQDDEQCISDTFDWHIPQYRSWHTVEEVRSWFIDSGFEVDWVGDFPVSMRGIKCA